MGKAKKIRKNQGVSKRDAAIEKRARELAADYIQALLPKVDICIAYTLWSEFGFGKRKRLRRFFLTWYKVHMGMLEEYRSNGDDSHYLVMEKRLRDAGIDVKELAKEEEDECEKNT